MEEQESFDRVPRNHGYGTELVDKNQQLETVNEESIQDEVSIMENSPNNAHANTYIEIVAERDESGQPLSILEVDLVISREKGKETRRLEMNFAGIDLEKKEMIEKSVSISRENFEILKHFFCHLDWNS